MGKSAVTFLLFASLCTLLPGQARCETKAEEARKKDRGHTAIMSRGAFASPMSWDRKTVVMTQDGNVVAEEIYSPNKRNYAYADLSTDRTTVYGIVRQGRIGRRVELWTMPGCHEMLALSNDGERLVTGFSTEGRAILGSHPDLVILTIFEKGKMAREFRLKDLLPDKEGLSKVDSMGVWGRYRRLNPTGYYVIETIDGKDILVDVSMGEVTGIELDERGDIEDWKRYVDVFNWFELQYPGDCQIKERRNYEGYPTGSVILDRADSGWTVRTDLEQISNYMTDGGDEESFVEFAIHLAKIMNSADGPTSAVYVDSVISKEVYTNPGGVDIVELLLSVVDAEWTDEEQIEVRSTKVMYSALLALRPGEPRRVLFLRPAYGSEDQVGSSDLLKRIVDTIGYPESRSGELLE